MTFHLRKSLLFLAFQFAETETITIFKALTTHVVNWNQYNTNQHTVCSSWSLAVAISSRMYYNCKEICECDWSMWVIPAATAQLTTTTRTRTRYNNKYNNKNKNKKKNNKNKKNENNKNKNNKNKNKNN